MNALTAYLVSFCTIAVMVYFGRRNRAQGWRKPAGGSLESWRALMGRREAADQPLVPGPVDVAAASQGLAALGIAVRENTPEWEQASQATPDSAKSLKFR